MTPEEREKLLEELLRQFQPRQPSTPNNSTNNSNNSMNSSPRSPSSLVNPSFGGGKGDSGGIFEFEGSIGQMPMDFFPNSKLTMRDKNGQRIQQRWYNSKGQPRWNRDFKHGERGGKHTFPHDHRWENGQRIPENLPVNPWIN